MSIVLPQVRHKVCCSSRRCCCRASIGSGDPCCCRKLDAASGSTTWKTSPPWTAAHFWIKHLGVISPLQMLHLVCLKTSSEDKLLEVAGAAARCRPTPTRGSSDLGPLAGGRPPPLALCKSTRPPTTWPGSTPAWYTSG